MQLELGQQALEQRLERLAVGLKLVVTESLVEWRLLDCALPLASPDDADESDASYDA